MSYKKGGGSAGKLISGKQAVGNQIITNKGYGEGQPGGGELIGAKKIKGPKGI
ncbi:MAG: hypothetical protein ACYTEU_09230 [Planctomycetota bacterium]|jgi:hypothetical protein